MALSTVLSATHQHVEKESVIELARSGLKLLPASYVKNEDERPKLPHNAFSKNVPVVSLLNSAGLERDRVKSELKRACEEWGVFQVVDHGLPEELNNRMMRETIGFFSLPAKEKCKYSFETTNFVGYASGSVYRDDPLMDWRELYAARGSPRDVSAWPSQPPQMRSTLADYSDAMLELWRVLLELISEILGLESEAIQKACGEGEQKVVLNYYPECPQPELALGLKRHTDPGVITIALQDRVGGLQVTKDDGNSWVTVEPIEGAFVVFVGDILHILSNGRLKKGDHQAAVNSCYSRVSIVTFYYPNALSVVRPLDGLINEENPAKFDRRCTFKEIFKEKILRDYVLRAELKRKIEGRNENPADPVALLDNGI